MSPEVSERSFEEAIECGLLQRGPDACPGDAAGVQKTVYGNASSGGYRKRAPEHYDRELCLIPTDVVDFVLATQPKQWEKLKQHYGAAVREQFLTRLAAEIKWRGALDVLRNGIKDSGCSFQLAFFRPASGLMRRPVGSTKQTCSPSCANSATAKEMKIVSILCCF
jgi:type I restriction enzyme R subunit